MVKNTSFIFIKPHAVTDKTKELVKETLEAKGMKIKTEGTIEGKTIDEKKLVDRHYYAIASKATLLKPDKLNIPKEKFKEKFGQDWNEMLKAGKCYNAKDACEKLELDGDAMEKEWAKAKKAGKLIKFGGGFYCGDIEIPGKEQMYVFNGFFMSMRSKYVAEGASLYYYVVEWDSKDNSWADFREKILGATDPNDAPKDSLRGLVLAKWKELGLASCPDVGDNGLHGSASPFESLAERMNWLNDRVDKDYFGSRLLKAGVSRKTIKDWALDPQVTYGPVPMTRSLYDSLEDTDTDYCLALCQMIAGEAVPDKNPMTVEKATAENKVLKQQIEQYKELAAALKQLQAFKNYKIPKAAPPPPPPKSEGKGKGKGKGKAAAAPPAEKKPAKKGKGGGKGGKGKGGGGKGKGGKGKY